MMPAWLPILPGAGPPTAFIFSWPCWPTTSTAGCCCSSERKRRRWPSSSIRPWRSRVCAFCSWRLRSGATPDALGSAIAISTRNGDCSTGSWIACATSLRARRALRPCCSLPYDREPCIISYALVALNRQQLRKTEQNTKREDESVSDQDTKRQQQ